MLLLLHEALEGWDALELELREAARLPGADTAGISSAAQCCADAVAALLDADALRWAPCSSDMLSSCTLRSCSRAECHGKCCDCNG